MGPENPAAHEAGEGSSSDRSPVAICYCRGGEHGQMVGCDNDNCPYQWFHLDCLKLKAFPKSRPGTALSAKSGEEANIPEFNVLTRFQGHSFSRYGPTQSQ